MLIIPAIDLQDGCVVRLTEGYRDKKIYSRNPVITAKHWVKQGAQILHVVDLDAAMSGVLKNIDAVKAITKAVDVPVEFGGGVRSLGTIRELLKAGVYRVVLGTKAVEDKDFLEKAFREFKEQVIVSVDARAGQMLIKGWKASSSSLDMNGFIKGLKGLGFGEFIFTDISKDGTLKGPNIKETKRLLKDTGMRIILSGGVSSLSDITKIKGLQKNGLVGVIIGKALYEGRFTLPAALIRAK